MKKLTMSELEARHAELRQALSARGKGRLVLILDGVRSALNVGSVFRTADVFAVDALALCGITAQPPQRDILKTALGATDTVAWQYFESVQQALAFYRSEGYSLLALEQTKDSIFLSQWAENRGKFSPDLAVVLGNEVEGVSEEALQLVDACIEIPQWGEKHSLNVSVAAGVLCWELRKK